MVLPALRDVAGQPRITRSPVPEDLNGLSVKPFHKSTQTLEVSRANLGQIELLASDELEAHG